MRKKLTFKESLFILPAVLIIAIFSLWPVLQSLTYTLFDYQLNNQQKAGLYVNERFNVNLFQETELYVGMFLEDDLEHITATEDQLKTTELVAQLEQVAQQYADKSGVIQLSDEQADELQRLYQDASALVQDLTSKYELTHATNLPTLVEDINRSMIPSNFIGLEGYQRALSDKRIGIALGNTLIFTLASVSIELVLGLGLALILNKAIRGQGLIRTTSLIPWAIPTAVAALMWCYLYDGTSGVVAYFFENIGLIERSQDLLLTSTGAMFSAILADVWKTTPYMALLILAGLQNIQSSLYEAASMDGANKVQSFFRITLPLLKPAILVALLFRTLDAFRVFDLIYVLTGGGPGGSTETLSIYAYKVMFGQTNFGYGSVIVIIMFVCVAIIATLFVRLLGTNLMEKN